MGERTADGPLLSLSQRYTLVQFILVVGDVVLGGRSRLKEDAGSWIDSEDLQGRK
jgi:hypothetical protein